MPRFINKINGCIEYIDRLQGEQEFNCIQIPEEGNFILDENNPLGYTEYVEPIDISAIKLQGIDFLTAKITEKKKEKFIVEIHKAGDGTINIETDLQDSTLNGWVIVKNTIPQDLKDSEGNIIAPNVRFVHLIHAEEPYLDEFVPITEEELLRLNTFLTNTVNGLTQTIVNISNMIKTAPDELVLQVYNMTPEEKDAYAQAIIEQYTPAIQI